MHFISTYLLPTSLPDFMAVFAFFYIMGSLFTRNR